ncbi:MAG: OmpA/MotB family protein [Planctomycetota bacterium]
MRTVKLSAICVMCASILLVTGCNGSQDLRIQNERQQALIDQLQTELGEKNLELGKVKRQLAAAQQAGSIDAEALQEKLAALEADRAKLLDQIAQMQQKLLFGGAALPVELATLLEDFAKDNDMITYDASRGIVKFKSDLLFERGSDKVKPSAATSVKALSAILNSEQARKFDVIIAGHTDDMRIARPDTKAKHPTNWHLSVHRAISVKDVMESSNIEPKRMSVRGFGEYRPIAENLPGKKGNPQNRRVEIFIVPQGM